MEKRMRSEGRYRLVLAAAVVVLVVAAVLIGGWYGRQGEAMDNAASGLNFVNARISEEEVEKYGLRELWDRYDPDVYGGMDPFAGGYQEWVVDKSADAFLMRVDSGGRDDPGRLTYVLHWKNQDYVAVLRLGSGTSKSFKEVPYVKYWELKHISGPGNIKEAKQVLKSALTAYGAIGLLRKIDDVVLHFDF